MTSLKLTKLKFRFGPPKSRDPLEVGLKNITILVGPNNSGKSQTLKEIEMWNRNKYSISNTKLLADADISFPSNDEEIYKLFEGFGSIPTNRSLSHDEVFILDITRPGSGHETVFKKSDLRRIFLKGSSFVNFNKDSNSSDLSILNVLCDMLTIKLDGRNRFYLMDKSPAGDLVLGPTSMLSLLFLKDAYAEKLSKIIFEEFKMHFYVDPSASDNLRIRMNRDAWSNRRSLDPDTLNFFKKSDLLKDMGDGIQAFVSLILSVSCLPHKFMLIDEPEAYLHPPSVESLGRHLSNIALQRDASLICATHSSDFVMGCLDTTSELSIIRLTHYNEDATATQLSTDEINYIRSNPLLRSTDILSALFHQSAVVVEGNTDRVFYREINRRLRLDNQNKGIPDCVFLDALGKNVVHHIAASLRRMGIPAACIYDLDILRNDSKEGQKLWKNVLLTLNYPSTDINSLEIKAANLQKEFDDIHADDNGPDIFKKRGLYFLPEPTKSSAFEVLAEMKRYGIFIVPVGTVERWLQYLGIQVQNERWISKILVTLEQSDVKPTEDDVWQFLVEINEWITDPNRYGMS